MQLTLVVAVCLSVGLSGCRSRTAQKNKAQKLARAQKSGAEASNVVDPDVNLNCVVEHIQNPPEAFHYSYKKASSSPLDEEADITPQSIDGTFSNGGFSGSFHGSRSDADSWQTAQSHLMGIAGMSSAVAIVNHRSAIVREGSEKVNGYDTVKYSIDTVHGNSAEEGLYRIVLGDGGFERGTVWVTAQGCPVKFILTSELHSRNGSVDKVQYEEAMVKK
jgi:hypothetical protein